jgi:heterodisulfide reductase subunit A
MYAVKQAVIAKEHTPGLEANIFYMDLRAFGKEFEEYYVRAQREYNVQFVRSRVASVQEVDGGNLLVRYDKGNKATEEIFDLVVLSVGLVHPKDSAAMAEVFGIDLNEYGFARTDMLKPLETTRPGVFACGAFSGPKDIPDTVAQASGAAAKAAGLIAGARCRRQGAAYRSFYLPLRHQHRGRNRCPGGNGICQDVARGALCGGQPVYLLAGHAATHQDDDRRA